MKTLFAVPSLAALALCAHVARAQTVPIVNLPPALAKTTEKFGLVLGVRQISDGKVFVNDGGRHQIKLFDSTLTKFTIVADSTSGAADSYGPLGTSLIPYFGDSSLFADFSSQTILVLDAKGQVARTLAPPSSPGDFGAILIGPTFADAKGRLYYRANVISVMPTSGVQQQADSAAIVRADLDVRRVDTLGRVKQRDKTSQGVDRSDPSKIKVTITLNPLPALDAWTVLSDGTVAFVRGHDYHVDLVHPDGTTSSSPKLPFDWKRLTDDDKQKLIDSARAAQAAMDAARGAAPGVGGAGGGGGGGRGGGGAVAAVRGGGDPSAPIVPTVLVREYLPLKDITDYWPAIRTGAAVPDRDENVWILPTTSAQSQHGELIYDVVNAKGELFERVRLPVGRSLAGFGKGGVVYLADGDRTNGFYLERTRLSGGAAKASKLRATFYDSETDLADRS